MPKNGRNLVTSSLGLVGASLARDCCSNARNYWPFKNVTSRSLCNRNQTAIGIFFKDGIESHFQANDNDLQLDLWMLLFP
jgi:hypothetical protein